MGYRETYKRKTITRGLRDWLLKRFQIKDVNSPDWRFLHYALLGQQDKVDGLLPISQETLAKIEGVRNPRFANYVAERFLEKMKTRFSELKIQWLEPHQGLARRLVLVVPEDVRTRLANELATLPPESERVYFLDGTIIDRRKRKTERDKQLKEVNKQNVERGQNRNVDEILILDYLNGLPSNHFTKLINDQANIERTLEAISQLPEEKQERERNTLEKIQLQPQQFYTYSRNSCRLAPYELGLCSLKSSIRKVLTHNWLEVDLKNVHLAINAKVWDVPEVQVFLETGKSWWTELFEWCGLEPSDDIKAAFKERTYALSYGMSEKKLRSGEDFDYELASELTEKFLQHRVVQAIIKRRDEMLKKIAEEKGAYDAYGRWIELEISYIDLIKQKRERINEVTETSVLAQVSQSYEQVLIAEVFKLAKDTKDFTVTLYQYDGVSLVFKDKKRKDLWLNRVLESVKRKADELGIKTELAY